MVECDPLSSNISLLDFFFRDFDKRIYADTSKTTKELKDAIVSELGTCLIQQMADKAVADPKTASLPVCRGDLKQESSNESIFSKHCRRKPRSQVD